MSAMKLSILIVNYNSGALSHACITSLLAQGLPSANEIIVVDNGSTDDSVSFLRSDFPGITVLANDANQGLAKAVNQGLRRAQGEYILLLNPDITVLPGGVMKLLAFMEQHSDVGVAGGKLLSPNGRLQYSTFRFYRPMTIVYRRTWLGRTQRGQRELDRFLMRDFDHQAVRDVEWLMGSCYLLRRSAVNEVGGMDERFFLYFEDVDWCRRFWEKGWRVTYVPEARFSHFHQRSSGRSHIWGIVTNWTTREHIRSAIKYFWKYRRKEVPTTPQT